MPRVSDARGYTLIELMIVVMIIANLAAIGLGAYNGQRRKAHATHAVNALTLTHKTMVSWKLAHGDDPSGLTAANVVSELKQTEPSLDVQVATSAMLSSRVPASTDVPGRVFVFPPFQDGSGEWGSILGAFTAEGYTYTMRFSFEKGAYANADRRVAKGKTINDTYCSSCDGVLDPSW